VHQGRDDGSDNKRGPAVAGSTVATDVVAVGLAVAVRVALTGRAATGSMVVTDAAALGIDVAGITEVGGSIVATPYLPISYHNIYRIPFLYIHTHQ
jgi:hypothetical protein